MSRKGVVMDFRDGLSAELPAPRDDEPGSLRDDILDELADHLVCAYRRELLRGADAATANQRVLQRFGDPAALARRLWLDAMKGRIMSQRILVVCCIVLTVISLSLFFLMWNQAEVSRRLIAAELARSEADRERAEAARRELLQKLEEMSRSAATPRSPDWIPVKFKLTQGTPDGPPAVGFGAKLGRGIVSVNSGSDAIDRESDKQGMIDFGVVQPGDWGFALYSETWQTTGTLNVLPGTTITKTIVCPETAPEQVPLSVQVEWPPDLAESGLGVFASFFHQGFTYQPPLHWFPTDSARRPGCVSVLCVPDTKRPDSGPTIAIDRSGFSCWQLQDLNPGPPGTPPLPTVKPFKRGQAYLDLPWLDSAGESSPVKAVAGGYQVQELAIVRPQKELAEGFRGERCELLVHTAVWGNLNFTYLAKPPGQANKTPGDFVGSAPEGDQNAAYTSLTPSYWSKPPAFELKKGRPNVWTIHLPDELTRAVREKLKAEKK